MAEPDIVEVQEHIIEMDGVRYHLEQLQDRDFTRTPHQPWCEHCHGNDLAPREDEDRYRIFDHYCSPRRQPLRCDPDNAVVYRRMDTANAPAHPRAVASRGEAGCSQEDV